MLRGREDTLPRRYCREDVIVDLTGLADPVNRQALREAVNAAGLAAHVRWYE